MADETHPEHEEDIDPVEDDAGAVEDSDSPEEPDWEARESDLLDLKADELRVLAGEMDLSTSGTKAELAARIIAEEQDALLEDEDEVDADDDLDLGEGEEVEVDESDDAALADAMADEAADPADEEDAKALADHERAHNMGVTATPGTAATLDPDRLVAPASPKEPWDALAKNIEADLVSQVDDLFEDAAEASVFAAEFSTKLAKYKYKLATAKDTFQKRMYAQNIKHLEAQVATEVARVRQRLVKQGDALLERILMATIKTVAGAALGALI